MKNKKKSAFTLVEVIVVVTILAILSTVGFVAYTDYLRGVRDSNRIQQMSEIHKGVTLYGVKSKLPNPEEELSIVSGLSSVGIQGYATQGVLDAIKFTDGGIDPKTKKFYTYFVSADRKYAQILGFFEERNENELLTYTQGYADTTDYSSLYPQVVGAELGTLLQEDTQIPIQDIEEYKSSGTLDILSASGSFLSYATNQKITKGSGTELIGMVPRISCKKILEEMGSAPNGVYKINPSGNKQIEVFCNMDPNIDNGGWIFAGFIDNDTISSNISFINSIGFYDENREDNNEEYLLKMDDLNHTEMLWSFDQDLSVADTTNKLIQIKYDIGFPGFYSGPVIPCTSFFDETGSVQYKFSPLGSNEFKISSRTECAATAWGFRPTDNTSFALRLTSDVDGANIGKGAQYDSRLWGIESGDAGYSNGWGNNVWIYVR